MKQCRHFSNFAPAQVAIEILEDDQVRLACSGSAGEFDNGMIVAVAGLAEHEAEITTALGALLAERPAGTWCAGTWRGDGHPDHAAVGRAVIRPTAFSRRSSGSARSGGRGGRSR